MDPLKNNSCLHKAFFMPAKSLMPFNFKGLLLRELFEKNEHVVFVDLKGEYTRLKEAEVFENDFASTEKNR